MYAPSIKSNSDFNSGTFLIASFILSFISAAAAFVKVKTSNSFTWVPSRTFLLALSVRTAVFPEPAPADTIIFVPSSVMACCCSFVNAITPHLLRKINLLLYQDI